MTTIRSGVAQPTGPRAALDVGNRIPFGLIDTNGSGRISKAELTTALGRIYPSLSDKQLQAISDGAFSTLKNNGMHMTREGWTVAEPVVLQTAQQCDAENAATRGTTPSGWNTTPGVSAGPAIIGQNQIPLPPAMVPGQVGYLPRNDYAMTGYNPYQYPMGMPPMMPGMPGYESGGSKMAKGAGRGLLGFLKMIPIVGNVINGIDFIRDIPKALKTFGNPQMTFGQKLKAGADLLFHGAGMLVPQVGAGYDMAQGAVRVAGGAMQAMSGHQPWGALPPYAFNSGGIPPLYNMSGMNPMMQSPYAYGQFPNYTQYPPYPATGFMPPYLQQSFMQPYPMLPYGSMGLPGMMSYDPFMGSPYGYGMNPYMMGMGMGMGMGMNPMLGTPQDGIAGAGRAMLGAVKMLPGLGNIINGVDFVRDIGHLGRAMKGDPTQSVWKSGADLLFHGAGMFIPQVGGAYDMAQGTMRAGAAAMNPMNYGAMLPPFGFNPGGFPPMYPGIMF